MDDLISRQSVIELLNKWSDGYGYIEIPTKNAFEAFMRLPSAQPEQRWIPVTEPPKKPDNYPKCEIRKTYYLVSLESGCVESLGYDFDRDEWMITGSPVVAWMPLPEPYQERGKDEEQ